MAKLLVIQALVAWVVLNWLIRRHRKLESRAVISGRRLPKRLRDRTTDRTWVLVTDPATGDVGGSAEQNLRRADPAAHVVHLRADADGELVQLLRASHLPTLILADDRGWVRHRLDGPHAVLNHLESRS